jgi:bacillopeptidase F
MLLASAGMPRFVAHAQTGSDDAVESLHGTQALQPENKISADLTNAFDNKQEQVTFLVKFKEQANTKKVAEQAVKDAKTQELSAAKAELRKRSAVV